MSSNLIPPPMLLSDLDRRSGRPGAEHCARDTVAKPLLISLHLPKTAGTSFAAALQARFGERYRADYADLPMQQPRWPRQWHALREALWHRRGRAGLSGVDAPACIHGHFLPIKYLPVARSRPLQFVTWLRDPVERVISHYHFWLRDYDGGDPAQPLRNRMLQERWSLERFALGAEMRNVYTQYLWRFSPKRFSFIGVTERYAEDLAAFADRYLDGTAVVATALANPHRRGHDYGVAADLRRRIEAHHAADVALYRRVRDRTLVAAR